MRTPLRVLIVEDQENDAAMLLAELDRLGYEVISVRVETAVAMSVALAEQKWDLIISDFSLPQFSALDALSLCRDRAVEVPFLIVSGQIGEEEALESMRLGALDFMTKGRLARLGPAITRALRGAEERQARRVAEARLKRAEKLEAIGQLAGGVAHDFNNLLAVIQGYGDLLMKDLSGDAPRQARLDAILRAANRGASLTRQLLTFSRQHPFQARPVDLNAVVTEMEGMLRRLISEDVQITTRLMEGLHLVKADPAQIEQVVMNLAINGRDAMSGGGRLIIETSNVDLDDTYIMSHPDAKAGPYALLTVSDTGHGMGPDTVSHIFEPFFTTKEPGKGTGLGLATVYGIVRQSGGHIAVYSEPGRGSTFRVYLPRTDEAAQALAPPRAPEVLSVGSETVLLVEDDPMLQAVIQEALQSGGYTVITGLSPEASLAAAADHTGPIHLMLTDVVMPRISGPEVAVRAKATRPGMKVLYMSGYVGAAAEHQTDLPPSATFLQKPFSVDALLRKVRETLESPQ
jgi:signal transduction histidine kinase